MFDANFYTAHRSTQHTTCWVQYNSRMDAILPNALPINSGNGGPFDVKQFDLTSIPNAVPDAKTFTTTKAFRYIVFVFSSILGDAYGCSVGNIFVVAANSSMFLQMMQWGGNQIYVNPFTAKTTSTSVTLSTYLKGAGFRGSMMFYE